MNVSSRLKLYFFFIIVFSSIFMLEAPLYADDEVVYFSGQIGSVIKAKLSDINNVGGSYQSGTTASDLKLKNSFMYGAKMGIYSKRGILALEAEYFRTNPNIKKQNQTFHEPSFGPYNTEEASDVTIDTWAINVIGRVPVNDRLVVYAGAGPAYFRSTFKDNLDTPRGGKQHSNRYGYNVLAGINYFVKKNIGVFVEWKYNHAKFKVPNDQEEHGFNANYNANFISAGIGYYFDVPLPWRMPWTLRSVFGLPEGQQPPL